MDGLKGNRITYDPQEYNVAVGNVITRARVYRDRASNQVRLEVMLETPLGPLAGFFVTDPETAERMIAKAEAHNLVPRIANILEKHTGSRPTRLMLPR